MKNLKFSSRFVSAGVAFVLLLGILAGAFYFHGMGAAAHATAPYKSHPITVKPIMTPATFDGKHNLFTC